MKLPDTLRSLTFRLFAVGVLVVVSAFVVLLSGFGQVHRSSATAELIGRVQRYHQDADQAHDAVHTDVLQVLRSGTAATSATPTTALAVLRADVGAYRSNVDRASRPVLSAELSLALASLRPAEFAYADMALALGEQAATRPARALATLPAFQDRFEQLARTGARVTERLAATQARAANAARHTERNNVAAALVAVAGLFLAAGALVQLGRRAGNLLRRERDVAQTLQRSLLPGRLPELPGAQLAARFLPCEAGSQVGGDWYDVIPLPGGALGLVIGDVTGHDIAAAAAMAQIRNALRAWALADPAPADLLDRLNQLLFAYEVKHMATCIYVRFPAEQLAASGPTDLLRVCIANAGHWPPLLVSPAGEARLLEQRRCLPLGALADTQYQQHEHQISVGSTLLLYTDGLIEHRQRVLDSGLQLLLRTASDAARTGAVDPERMCDLVLRQQFNGKRPDDDVALLAIKFISPMESHPPTDEFKPGDRSPAASDPESQNASLVPSPEARPFAGSQPAAAGLMSVATNANGRARC